VKDSHHQSPDGKDMFKGKLPHLVQETACCSVSDVHGKDAQQARCAGCRVPVQNILAIVIRVSLICLKQMRHFFLPCRTSLNTPLLVESGIF
jgi:hypothetical protein